jgi:lipopolysaccharide export system permease protein
VNLLDRHIFRGILSTAAAAVGLFAFVLVAENVIRDLMGPLLSGQLPLLSFGRLVLLLVPFVISYALPLGMLAGVLLTLGRLSSDSEITAMRSAGMSIVRIARPALVLGVLGAALGLRVNFESMPWARIQYHRELATAVRTNPLSYLQPRTFIRDFPGRVIYIGSTHAAPGGGTDVEDIWYWQLDSERRVVRFVRARAGHVAYDDAGNEFVITLQDAIEEEHDSKAPDDYSQPVKISHADAISPIRLSLARFIGGETVHQKLQWMTYGELRAERLRVEREPVAPDGLEKHARDLMKVDLTFSDKLTMAVAIFTFAFVAVPLGIRVSRRETSANLAVAVMLALGYYLLIVVVGWLDQYPGLRPDLLLWVPNLAMLALGVGLLRSLDRP